MHRGALCGNKQRFLPKERWGIGLFVEDGGYTTVAAAVSALVVIALIFSSVSAAWTMTRSGDVQLAADASALAGSNVVSSYRTAAVVLDASIATMGFAGMLSLGAGMVGMLVPGAQVAAEASVQTGIKMLTMRNRFASSASRGLQTLESALPYLVAANASRTVGAQSSDSLQYVGTALAVPTTSASEFPAIETDQVPVDDLEETAQNVKKAAQELQKISERTAQAKERAWLADCGDEGRNMQERAARLTELTDEENPDFASSIAWDPEVGLDRARTYYAWRFKHETPESDSVEAQADSAARKVFYQFAQKELAHAHIAVEDGMVRADLPLLPKNTEEVRKTSLYTDVVWPSSNEPEGLTLHFDPSCPGATGTNGPALALSSIDQGKAHECPVCKFSVGDVGKVPAASTSIDNGFEYHFRAFILAVQEYAELRQQELIAEQKAQGSAELAGGQFEQAIKGLSGVRPTIAPPGRFGCVAFVSGSAAHTPSSLDTDFAATASVQRRGAIAAAALAPQESSEYENVLSSFFSTLEDRINAGGLSGLASGVMDLWGTLLSGYADLGEELSQSAKDLVGDYPAAGPVASGLGTMISGAVDALDLEPVDVRLTKPVLVDSAPVIQASDVAGLHDIQDALRSLPLDTADPSELLESIGYHVTERIDALEVTLAEIPLPQGGTLPLTIRVRDLPFIFENT